MSNTQSPSHESEISSHREMTDLTGRVKWFNRKNGYGFIVEVGRDVEEPQEIFVHYDNISTSQEQFRYLVEGEYVHFDIGPSSQADHEVEAHNVRGIEGEKLMCETRREQMEKRPPRRPRTRQGEGNHQQGQQQRGRGGYRGRGRQQQQRRYVPKGQVVQVDNTQWMMVPIRTMNTRGRGRGRGGGGYRGNQNHQHHQSQTQ